MLLHRKQVKAALVRVGALLAIWPSLAQCLIITSVIAGDKKFKTISFDSKFLKPLMFETELPTTEFRRHRTVRPPKFDIDVNIPIKLPLEDAYGQQQPEYKKPVVSDIAFETGEIVDHYKSQQPMGYYGSQNYAPASEQKPHYPTSKIQFKESLDYAASQQSARKAQAATATIASGPQMGKPQVRSGSDWPVAQRRMEPTGHPQNLRRNSPYPPSAAQYPIQQHQQHSDYYKHPEFVPGGFVNLQLSGPTGGPKMTYEDFDREKWAQQLSQTAGAMPFPILNYHQLQNFYGGLGTFTNGLAENRYTYVGPLEKLKKMLSLMG